MRIPRIFVFAFLIISFVTELTAFQIYDLKTDYATGPLGVENPSPVFSWKMINEHPGAKQEGYEIRITDANGNVVWDTGLVKSELSNNIRYEGKNLNPRSRYNLQLKVKDNNDQIAEINSFFETGLMSPNEDSSLWEGSQWIGGDNSALPFNAFYLPVFQIQFDFKFDQNANKAEFIYGRNDARLPENSNITLQLSLGEMDNKLNPSVAIFSKGYSFANDGKTYPENSLMTGFIGTAWISKALSNASHDDVAYDILLNEQFPSWLYPITLDATTIWERLNSMTKEEGFGGNNHMNSFNHYAYGSVLNWMINTMAGIIPDKENPGFKHFYLRPVPEFNGRINKAETEYESLYGKIESKWEISEDRKEIIYEFDIPANSSATLQLPGEEPMKLESGNHTFVRKTVDL